jgi:ABC-type transport system involved in cytochrome bd biosynthesis fused ATPase/permease subunit
VLAAILVGIFNPCLGIPLLGFLLMAGTGVSLLVWALSRTPGQLLIQVRSELNATLVDGIQGLPICSPLARRRAPGTRYEG